jgi:hypothetical protein
MIEILDNIEIWEKIYGEAINEYGYKLCKEGEEMKLYEILRRGEELPIIFLEIWAEKMEGKEFISDIRGYLLKEIEKRKYYEI